MEKILSDIQLAEVDVRYYEILRDDAMRDRCHTLAYVWQGKAEEAKKLLESLYQQEQAMQALDKWLKPSAEYCYVQDEPDHTPGWFCQHPEHAYDEAWAVLQSEDIDPRNQDEEFAQGLAFILDGKEPF